MTTMRRLGRDVMCAAALTAAPVAVWAQEPSSAAWTWVDVGASPVVREFKGGEGITLDLTNGAGDIVVVGGKGREGRLSITRSVDGTDAQVERAVRELRVAVAEHANRIAVRTVPQRTSRGPARVRTNYEIALPQGTALELRNMQGNVVLRNLAGDVRVEAVAGNVVAEAMSRVRMLRSVSGNVTLERSTLEGDATLQTVSGNVVARAVKARTLTLGTVSGGVSVRDSSSDRALVRTVSGNIEYAAAPRKAGRYEFRTHAGDIVVHAVGGPGFEFEANTLRGLVEADVPTESTGSGMRQVRGSVGDGSAFFDLASFEGTIKVIRKR